MTRNYACQAFASADDIFNASCGCDLDINSAADQIFVNAMIDQASDMLSLSTGGAVNGVCTKTVRPVALCTNQAPYWGRFEHVYPTYPSHDWRRRFDGLDTIPLRGPRTDIVEIVIDGVVLAASAYGLLDNKYLVRKDGKQWPSYQDLTKDETQTGTWAITYRFGYPPDELTRMACVELACELIKDSLGKKSMLPRGVTSANIQGATIQVRDRAQALREGDEQIPVVARFFAVYAQESPGFHPGVWSPEIDQAWNLVEYEGPSGS